MTCGMENQGIATVKPAGAGIRLTGASYLEQIREACSGGRRCSDPSFFTSSVPCSF